MPYQHSPVGLAIRDYKLAALFFERIMQFGSHSVQDPTPNEILYWIPVSKRLSDDPRWKDMHRPGETLDDFQNLINKVVPSAPRVTVQTLENFREVRAIDYARSQSTRQVPLVPLVFSPRAFDVIYEGGESDALQILVSGLPFVDTSKAKWAQILEVRKDKKSLSALRNLRLFFASNYEGKSSDFIIDDVQRRLESFEQARKKHGFDLLTSSTKILLDAKSILSVAGLAFAAAILGTPLIATAAALTGVSLEVGKLVVNIAEQKHTFRSYTDDHELAYLLELKKTF